MRNTNDPKFPCKVCAKNVHDKDKVVQCDLCELWIHIKCNKLKVACMVDMKLGFVG